MSLVKQKIGHYGSLHHCRLYNFTHHRSSTLLVYKEVGEHPLVRLQYVNFTYYYCLSCAHIWPRTLNLNYVLVFVT